MLSSDAEKLLQEVIQNNGTCMIDLSLWGSRNNQYNISLCNEIELYNFCKITKFITGNCLLEITGKGKDYFINKQKFEEQQNTQANITLNIGDNSQANVNTGSGQAIQTVTIYKNEQQIAINEFIEAVKETGALTNEQKEEIQELVVSMLEAKEKGRNSTFKSLAISVTNIVTTSHTLHAIWQDIVRMFGI